MNYVKKNKDIEMPLTPKLCEVDGKCYDDAKTQTAQISTTT